MSKIRIPKTRHYLGKNKNCRFFLRSYWHQSHKSWPKSHQKFRKTLQLDARDLKYHVLGLTFDKIEQLLSTNSFFQTNTHTNLLQIYGHLTLSTGASDRSFYLIFQKRFDQLETLLTIHRSKKVLAAGSLRGSLVASPQPKCPKRTFILPQKYHASVSNMLS